MNLPILQNGTRRSAIRRRTNRSRTPSCAASAATSNRHRDGAPGRSFGATSRRLSGSRRESSSPCRMCLLGWVGVRVVGKVMCGSSLLGRTKPRTTWRTNSGHFGGATYFFDVRPILGRTFGGHRPISGQLWGPRGFADVCEPHPVPGSRSGIRCRPAALPATPSSLLGSTGGDSSWRQLIKALSAAGRTRQPAAPMPVGIEALRGTAQEQLRGR